MTDPLLGAINAYRAGLQAYRDAPRFGDIEKENAFCEQAYGRALEVLETWAQPATSRDGALAALRLANEELTDFESSPTVRPMIAAAMAFFEAEGG